MARFQKRSKLPAPAAAPEPDESESADSNSQSSDAMSLTLGESAPTGVNFGRPLGAGEHSTKWAAKAEAITPSMSEPGPADSPDPVSPYPFPNPAQVGAPGARPKVTEPSDAADEANHG